MEDDYDLQQEGQMDQYEDISDAFANVGQGLDAEHKTAMLEYWQRAIDDIERISDDGQDSEVFKSTVLPLARIKKVMKTDSEVRMISAEAPILFAKGCDIFITELTMRAWIHAEENKRRTLQRSDIATALQKSDVFDFLIDLVPREEAQPRRVSNPTRHFMHAQRYDIDNPIVVNGPPGIVKQDGMSLPPGMYQHQPFDPRQLQAPPPVGLNALSNVANISNLNMGGMSAPFDSMNPQQVQFQQFPGFPPVSMEQQQQLMQQYLAQQQQQQQQQQLPQPIQHLQEVQTLQEPPQSVLQESGDASQPKNELQLDAADEVGDESLKPQQNDIRPGDGEYLSKEDIFEPKDTQGALREPEKKHEPEHEPEQVEQKHEPEQGESRQGDPEQADLTHDSQRHGSGAERVESLPKDVSNDQKSPLESENGSPQDS